MRPVTETELTECDREPIHLLGGIQPHGLLLAFSEPALTLAVVSANTESWLGASPEALLGRPLAEVLHPTSLALVSRALAQPSSGGTLRIEAAGRAFVGLLHRGDGLAVLDLEPVTEASSEDDALIMVNQLLSPLTRAQGPRRPLRGGGGVCSRGWGGRWTCLARPCAACHRCTWSTSPTWGWGRPCPSPWCARARCGASSRATTASPCGFRPPRAGLVTCWRAWCRCSSPRRSAPRRPRNSPAAPASSPNWWNVCPWKPARWPCPCPVRRTCCSGSLARRGRPCCSATLPCSWVPRPPWTR